LQDKIKSQIVDKKHTAATKTIRKVAECIVEKQFEFLEYGIRFFEANGTSRSGKAVEMHEIKISRVTSNKY